MSIIDPIPRLQEKKITRIEKENDEKEKTKLKNSVVKKTLILGDSIVKNVDG